MVLTQKESQDTGLISYLASQVISEKIVSLTKKVSFSAFVYDVNKHLIVKFPKNEALVSDWRRTAVITPILRTKLPVPIPCPLVSTAQTPDHRTIPVALYEKIQGEVLQPYHFKYKSEAFKIRVFEQLSDVVATLHRIEATTLPVSIPDTLDYGIDRIFYELGIKHAPKDLCKRMVHRLYYGKGNPGAPSLCHADLHTRNLCLSGSKLVGVLDFDSLSRGDAALEFRPYLYARNDLARLRHIYQRRHGITLDKRHLHLLTHIKNVITPALVTRYAVRNLCQVRPGHLIRQISSFILQNNR